MSRLAAVGGNAAGMSAAVARRRDPDLDVPVLERGAYKFRRAGIDVRILCEVADIDIAARTLTYRDHHARVQRQVDGRPRAVVTTAGELPAGRR